MMTEYEYDLLLATKITQNLVAEQIKNQEIIIELLKKINNVLVDIESTQ